MFVTWVAAHLRHDDPSSMKRHLQPFKTKATSLETHHNKVMRTKNLRFRQTGTISLIGRVDNPRQNELSSSRGLHTPFL